METVDPGGGSRVRGTMVIIDGERMSTVVFGDVVFRLRVRVRSGAVYAYESGVSTPSP